MAYIKQVSISSSSHMNEAIDYIAEPTKAYEVLKIENNHLENAISYISRDDKIGGEYASYVNCVNKNIAQQFKNTRKIFKQDKGVIAHHYIQSFSPEDNVTPEQAHMIGLQLIEKVAPNYQVVLSTHIDKEHIHNHFIINSCNIKTGYKWHSNKASLENMRKQSDMLCMKNDLSVINKNSKFKGIDQTTYQLAKKGKSWKINLVKDLDFALENCKSKIELIDLLNKKDYSVKYTDTNIMITKNGEKKGIRVDTLAKQFGGKYSKESIEKTIGYYAPQEKKIQNVSSPVASSEKKKRKVQQKTFSNEWERYEAWAFKKENNIPDIKFPNSSKSYSLNPQNFTLKVVLFFALMNSKKRKKNKTINWDLPNNKSKDLWAAEKRWKENQHPIRTVGNINFSQLKKAQGDNFQVKLPSNQLAALINQPIFYSARVDALSGTAIVTVKEKDKQFLSKLLGLSETSQLEKQNEALTNKDIYTKIKQEAQVNNEKLEYLIVTPEQLKELQSNFVEFASFNKDGKFNIAFLPKNKARISKLLFPQKEKIVETEFQKNSRINGELKTLSAVNNEKLRYKLITTEQYEKLKATDIKFAAFSQKETGKVNIVYLDSSSEKVNKATNEEQKKEQNMSRNMSR